MTFDEYELAAWRTGDSDTPKDFQLVLWTLASCGENGELANHIKKVYGHGHTLDKEYVKKELGDILWYVSCIGHLLDIPLGEIALANIEKLRKRYPEGFSKERSINRED